MVKIFSNKKVLMAAMALMPLLLSTSAWADTSVGDPNNYTITANNDNAGGGTLTLAEGQNGAGTTNILTAGPTGFTSLNSATTILLQNNGTNEAAVNAGGLVLDNTLNANGNNITGAGNVTATSFTGTLTTGAQTGITSVGTLSSLAVSGSSTLSGINNQAGGITNAGAISGTTTISSTGNATIATGAGTTNSFGTGADSSTTVGATGSGTTSLVGGTSGVTLSTAGGVAITGNTAVTGAESVSGNLAANGATNTIGTTQTSVNSIGTFAGSTTAIGDTTGVTGITGSTVNINTSNTANLATNIGSANASAGNIVVQSGATALSETTSSASLQVQNATTGVDHGISIDQSSTVISGGTHSTSLTLADNGATFANDQNGGAAQVHGVANGTSTYDAVNYGQLTGVANRAYQGAASAIAMANLPSPAPGKFYSIGAAYGNFSDQDAIAVGVKAVVGKSRNITLSVDYAYSGTTSSVGAGVGYSF